jgi:hypothetical protein
MTIAPGCPRASDHPSHQFGGRGIAQAPFWGILAQLRAVAEGKLIAPPRAARGVRLTTGSAVRKTVSMCCSAGFPRAAGHYYQ